MSTFTPQYQTATTLFAILFFLGWIILIGSIVFGVSGLATSSLTSIPQYPEYAQMGSAAILMIGSATGLTIILAGQMGKAMLDNTNANLEILNVLKAQMVDRNIKHHR